MKQLEELKEIMTRDYPNTIELIFMVDYLKQGKKDITYDIFKNQLENKRKQSEEEINNTINLLDLTK